jgi:hypothetical protein
MNVNYCDLCGQPMKNGNFYALYLAPPNVHTPDRSDYQDTNDFRQAYLQYLETVAKETKEVCPTCKHIFDKMFELRLVGLSELSTELHRIYNLPSKKNPKERDNRHGKDKKK